MALTIAHTPDVDDAFMFYAMSSRKITLPFELDHVIEDIEILNKMAFEAKLDVTAISAMHTHTSTKSTGFFLLGKRW